MMPSYVYYHEVALEEHMLYAKEIGEMYGISGRKASQIIEKHSSKQEKQKLFYKTKYGLARVYPESVWKFAMEQECVALQKTQHPNS
jgi:hypothetical protein